MADRQRLIAVCLSQVHNFLNTGFLNELSRVSAADGYGVAVFNTSLDFYWYQSENKIPRAGYRSIRYEMYDAFIIICHSFHDDSLIKEMVAGAQEHSVPVILLGMELPGCWTVVNDFEEGYTYKITEIKYYRKTPTIVVNTENKQNNQFKIEKTKEQKELARIARNLYFHYPKISILTKK